METQDRSKIGCLIVTKQCRQCLQFRPQGEFEIDPETGEEATICRACLKNMKYLGYANGWTETPACVEEAEEKGYKVVAETTGRCETTYTCEEGGWWYKVDSSD